MDQITIKIGWSNETVGYSDYDPKSRTGGGHSERTISVDGKTVGRIEKRDTYCFYLGDYPNEKYYGRYYKLETAARAIAKLLKEEYNARKVIIEYEKIESPWETRIIPNKSQ